jgi:hypothetical protein
MDARVHIRTFTVLHSGGSVVLYSVLQGAEDNQTENTDEFGRRLQRNVVYHG